MATSDPKSELCNTELCYLLLVLLQHVPKTNGDIPSLDEAFSDHQRHLYM